VNGYEDNLIECPFHSTVQYVDNVGNSVDILQLIPLVDLSTSCRQFIRWRCIGSVINGDSTNKRHTYWRNRDGEDMGYWGGASPVPVDRCVFFRAMLRRAQICHSTSSVCLPATCSCILHTGWNTSNSLRYLLRLTPTWATWGGFKGRVGWARKSAISLKRCKIELKLLWRTNRNSHTRFRLVPKAMTLDDFEWPKRHSCKNKKRLFAEPREKFQPYFSGKI